MKSLALVAALLLYAGRAAGAQLPPNEDWHTIRTRHFRVHFTPPVEEEARRAAVNAERAYAELSTELVPPRGTIDLVVSDNVDFVNGYATPFPSNRIVVFANPPTDASGLRNYDDWNALVVTHELTHIFHLDRSRGIWSFGQAIFGRNPMLFPNLYEPRWVLEGLAVYFESRLTGVGRLESSEHSMIARAAAIANGVPSLQELSPGTSRFPGGEVIYVYGSLLFDYLSRTQGPGSIRKFIESGSRTPLPFILTLTSRNAFGMSFQTAWEHWRDSLVKEMRASSPEPMLQWRQLTNAGRITLFPRWLSDTSLIYAGDNARETPAAYQVTLSGRETRLGRRNGPSPNVRMPDGGFLFSQPDYLDPYHIRNDLYIDRNGTQTRLTMGARLTAPDVRGDGEIVAVQDAPATTRLVRLSLDARTLIAITPTSIDVQWSDPRWSPDGTRIAAVKQSHGRSEIVILDPDGKVIDSFGATHSINSSPSWSAAGRRIFFSSERGGSPQVYVADVTTFAPSVGRITRAPTGVFAPEASPDRMELATLVFKADGYHLGVAPLPLLVRTDADSSRVSPRAGCTNCVAVAPGLPALGTADTSRATTYSPWASLLPRYWSPVVESSTEDGTSWGASTSGYDIVDRHDYVVEALHNSRWSENSAWLWYRYSGLGLPLIDLYASQNYANGTFVFDNGAGGAGPSFGLAERERIVSLQATFIRPRFRTYTLASIGGELEGYNYSTRPDTTLRQLNSFFSQTHTYPALVASAGWSNAQRPGLSISPEDGISLSATGRQRWRAGTTGGATRSVFGTTLAYKSLDLPGFAHHVLAFRAAGGITDEGSPDLFSAGGISATSLEVFPGFAVGQQRIFGVRGYPAGAESGIRAYSAAVEYRAPLAAPSRGFRFIPIFVDRMSMTLFGETGRAFCPAGADTTSGFCTAGTIRNPVMTSAGAELNIDTGLLLDAQARARLGLAFPLINREQLHAAKAELYARFGASF